MNESKQEPKAPSKQTSEKEISSQEMMLESKVPQGIKESLGLSSISTDITEVRQIVLHTLEIMDEPNNPARDLLASALKVLDKALHTISEEVSSVGVQEPSDGMAVEEGVATESPCDAVAAQETPPSTCNASAASELSMAAAGSCEDKISVPMERASVVEALVHEPAKSFTEDGTTNINASEINASIHDVSAASAVRDSSEVKASFSNKSSRSIKRNRSCDNAIDSCAQRSRNCSEILEPLRKSRRFSENTANFCQRETSEPDATVNATDETIGTDKFESVASSADVIADSELVVAVQEFQKDNISPMVEEVFSLNVHEPVKAVAVRKNSRENITLPMETVFSPAGHQLAKGEAAKDTTVINASEITTSTCNVTAASKLVMGIEGSFEDNATLPVEMHPSLDLPESSEGVDGDETIVIDAIEITTSTCNVITASNLVMVIEGSFEDNVTLPVEKRPSLGLPELSEGVDRDKTTVIDASDIATSTCNVTAASEPATAEEKLSEVTINLPLEKSSSVEVLEASEVLPTQEPTYFYEGEMTPSSHNVIAGQDLNITVDKYFESNITLPKEKVSLVDATDHAEAQSLMGVQAFSEENINLPVERVSSLSVHDSAEVYTEDGTTNLNASEINASIHDVSAASAVREFFDVKGSFSNKSLRSRKRERSSENFTESCAHLNCNCFEIWEPLRKSRRFSDNTANLCQRETSEPDEVNTTDETISTDKCESTASRYHVIADSELVVAVQETPKDNISPMVEEVFSLDVHEPVKAVALRENSKDDITLPMETVFSLAGQELAKTEAAEGAYDIGECEITASRCSATAASELVTAMESSEDNATLPVEKHPPLDLHELTEGVAGEETTAINESEITTSTCNVAAASKLVMAEEKSSEENATLPMKKHSYLDLRELSEGVDIDGTTVIDASDITTSTCNVTAASKFATAEETISELIITLPLEHSSSLDVQKSSEVLPTQEPTKFHEGKITTSSHNVIAGQDLFIAADKYFEGNITLPKELFPSVDETDHAEAIATDETTRKDESEIAASINDISAAPEVKIVVDGFAEEITLPVEKVSPLDVLKPAEATAADETTFTDGRELTTSVHGFSAASELLMVGKKSMDHGPAQDVATKEATTFNDMDRCLSSRSLRPVKRKRGAETAIEEESGQASRSCSLHETLLEPVRKSKRCMLNSGAETAASTSKAAIAPALLSEGAEAAATQTAYVDKIKIKTEGILARNSGTETPETMGYAHPYMSTACQLLCGAMQPDPAAIPLLGSAIQQSREASPGEPSQTTRPRRRRMKRVWNGEAFVSEGPNREHAEPLSVGEDHGEIERHL